MESIDPPPAVTMEGISGFAFKSKTFTVLGIMVVVLSITIILLLYVRHCNATYARYPDEPSAIRLSREHSGIDKKVIEFLPLFRFASLRGQKDGLECSVCLTKFESEEVLRLLPKCKHAFHVECVDTWLESHSTCPLCRHKVDQKDVLLVEHHESYKLYNYQDSNSSIHSGQHSSSRLSRGNSLEIIVENPEQDSLSGSSSEASKHEHRREESSMSVDSWKTAVEDWKHQQLEGSKRHLQHRIIISNGSDEEDEELHRWSSAGVTNLFFLRAEMLVEDSGGAINHERSASERIGMNRFRYTTGRSKSVSDGEGVGKRWMEWMLSRSQRQKRDAPPPTSPSPSSNVI